MKIYLFALPALLLASCSNKTLNAGNCDKICTEEFRGININFTNKNNQPVEVSQFTAVNLRTNTTLSHQPLTDPAAKGIYVVADDGDLKKLTNAGDDIKVSGTYKGEIKTATLKITGGECECHVIKKLGPDVIKFDQ